MINAANIYDADGWSNLLIFDRVSKGGGGFSITRLNVFNIRLSIEIDSRFALSVSK